MERKRPVYPHISILFMVYIVHTSIRSGFLGDLSSVLVFSIFLLFLAGFFNGLKWSDTQGRKATAAAE